MERRCWLAADLGLADLVVEGRHLAGSSSLVGLVGSSNLEIYNIIL